MNAMASQRDQIMLHSVLYNLMSGYCVFIWCIPSLKVKTAYINFLNHCYIDTEVEVKEIYTSTHMWTLFQDFLDDMGRVGNSVWKKKIGWGEATAY